MLNAAANLPLKDPSLFREANYVDGKWIEADSGKWLEVKNPATGTLVGRVPAMGQAETRRAIEAAYKAQTPWRKMLAKERSAILRKLFNLMMDNADDLAVIMTAEQGKPLAEAKGEIAYAASFIEWFAEEGKRVYGDTIPQNAQGRRIIVQKEPIGVFAAITPWNFPLAMITRKVAPALAAGCPVVIKPAEQTPLTALAAAELAQRAGMPPGVLNMLTSDAAGSVQIGKVLCASDVVRHLSFTGSTEVGRILMAQSAPTVKKLSLELGGNAPFIVFDDADVEAAVEGALQSKYRNAGQTCVCANRLYVQRGVYEEFVQRLARRVAELKVGPGTSAGVQIGPLIDQQGLDKVRRHVDDALARGARLLTGGKVLEQGGGRYFEPTVLADADASMLCAREETFGPVAPVFAFDTEEQAVAAANATEFGLAAYFYSRDLGRVTRVGEALEYGIVGVNTGLISNEVAPFGGVKQSGLGREGSHHGIDEYLELKYLCVGGIGA